MTAYTITESQRQQLLEAVDFHSETLEWLNELTPQAAPVTGERAELIAGFRELAKIWTGAEAAVFQKAADMLEADSRELARWQALAESNAKLVDIVGKRHERAQRLAQQVAAPYDQQAMELCDACGWKAIMPDKPCFVCNMKTEALLLAAPTGYALAMAVLQSSLYQFLDDVERAECDALIAAAQAAQAAQAAKPEQKPDWSAA